jgi:hypothetical protein
MGSSFQKSCREEKSYSIIFYALFLHSGQSVAKNQGKSKNLMRIAVRYGILIGLQKMLQSREQDKLDSKNHMKNSNIMI